MSGLDCLGCDDAQVGFDYGALLQTAGGLVQGGVNIYEQSEAEKKSKADAQKKLDAALAADQAAVAAVAKAAVSTELKSASAAADAAAAKNAIAKQDAVALDEDGTKKRLDAAEKSLANVKKNAAANPKDLFQPILVKAWTVTVDKIKTGVDAGKDKDKAKNEESWFSRRVVGPFSGTAVLVGVGVLGGLGFVVKRMLSR